MADCEVENDVIFKTGSDQEIVIEFSPQGWTIHPEFVQGNSYYKIQFKNGVFKTESGEPLVPSRNIIVGIPLDAKISIEILAAEKLQTIDGKLLPTPEQARDSVSKFIYQENRAIYQKGQLYPQQLVEISPSAMIRDQPVIIVSFYPAQFFPQRGQIELYNRIQARINFIGGHRMQHLEPWSHIDHLNRYLLINPDQSAFWRKTRFSKKGIVLNKIVSEEYFKIWIRDEGIYKVTGAELKEAGIDLSNIHPRQIKLFNNGGFQLPQSIHEQRPDSLIENAIFIADGNDGSFDPQDYILFYGKSVNGWKYNQNIQSFSHYLHSSTRENVYWLSWQGGDAGKRMIQKNITPTTSVIQIDSFYDHFFVEDEYKNLLNSGTIWLGNSFSVDIPERSYIFDLPGVLQNKEAMIKVNLAGISGGEQKFSLYLNNLFITQVPTFNSVNGEYLNITMKQFSTTFQASLQDGYNRLTIKYSPGSDINLAYIDWIEFSAQRQLQAKGDQLVFYGPDSIGFYNYQLCSYASNDIYVYDITNFDNVCQLKIHTSSNGVAEFIDSTSTTIPKKYIAVTPKAYKTPVKIEPDQYSDWRNTNHAADFIIISYDDFYEAALALKSLRENCDSLKTEVVKISDVYDEFSWGLPDVTSIRDFIKFAYEYWQMPPKYILLFGDGDFDYKNMISPHDPNWIPAYETADLGEMASRTRDDWFTCVSGNDNLMDLAIGRIPAKNPDEAQAAVQKIIEYENSPEIGEWCNSITMVADDEYGQGGGYDAIDHVPDAERIAEELIPKNYNIRKIYLTEYPAVHDPSLSGIRKPAAHEDLIKQINQGSLIINFIGHGNEQVWTHERTLALSDDFPQLNNGQRQAFWIAATCNFGRFDNPNFQSFAEQLVTTAKRGAIAAFSSSRLAEPFANVSLNRALYQFFFDRSNELTRLGDVIRLAKNSTGNTKNDQLYNLLGDPTLRLAKPRCSVQVTNCSPDSMKALSKMEIEGKIQFEGDQLLASVGQVLFKAFDSQKQRNYVVNQWKTYQYKLPGNTIFQGEVSLEEGQFKVQFIIPKDITYGGSQGRFSAFYWQDQLFGAGSLDNVYVGGTQTNFRDLDGPIITVGFEGQDFIPGGFVPLNPVLKVTIADSLSGVNIAGDIGHKITMTLDNNEAEQVELNDYFRYDRDSYLVGTISYPLTKLSEGLHFMQIKAWDNCNNSSQSTVGFTVVSQDELAIRDVLNFPNPFSNSTEFTFWTSQDCEVKIKIYTLSGRLICQLDDLTAQIGFNHFYWNGLDQDGDPLANGVYLYKIYASCSNSTRKFHVEQVEKCVIMR